MGSLEISLTDPFGDHKRRAPTKAKVDDLCESRTNLSMIQGANKMSDIKRS